MTRETEEGILLPIRAGLTVLMWLCDLSGELLRSVEDLRQFIAIMHFENREAAHALANDPEQDAWYQRVVSLTENAPVLNEYPSEWP